LCHSARGTARRWNEKTDVESILKNLFWVDRADSEGGALLCGCQAGLGETARRGEASPLGFLSGVQTSSSTGVRRPTAEIETEKESESSSNLCSAESGGWCKTLLKGHARLSCRVNGIHRSRGSPHHTTKKTSDILESRRAASEPPA